MLTYFEAHNFKSIKSLRLDMRPFMVLVGPNGAGKTNIVRALELFGSVLRRGTTDPIREQGYDQLIRREKKPARSGLGFTAHMEVPRSLFERAGKAALPSRRTRAEPLLLKVTLLLSGSTSSDEVAVQQEQLTLQRGSDELTARLEDGRFVIHGGKDVELWRFLALLLGYPFTALKEGPKLRQSLRSYFSDVFLFFTGQDEESGRLLRLLNWQRASSSAMRYLQDNTQVTRLRLDSSALRQDSVFEATTFRGRRGIGPSGEGLAIAIERLKGNHRTPKPAFRRILEALQQVYPRIEDIKPYRFQPGRLTLLFKERGISEELGQSNVSDGSLHALALLVALEGGLDKKGVLAIEEPENAIHPWSLRSMIERAQQKPDRQVLLTTHSETVVDAVQDPRALFIVENEDRYGTVVTAAVKKEKALKAILQQSGQKLGDVWLDGTLGGVPGDEP